MQSLKDKIPEKSGVNGLKQLIDQKMPVQQSPVQQQASDKTKIDEIKSIVRQKTQEQSVSPFPKPLEKKPKGPGLLASLEDKWYGFLDKLDEHIPVYKIIDPIDTVVPSFYLFSLIFFLLLAGIIGFFLFNPLGWLTPEMIEYKFRVVDETGKGVPKTLVTILLGDKTYEGTTDSFGAFSLRLPKSDAANVSIQKDGFVEFSQEITLLLEEVNEIKLSFEAPSYVYRTVELYKDGKLFNGTATLTFSCSNPNATPPSARTVTNGIARDIPVSKDCGDLSATVTSDIGTLTGRFSGNTLTLTFSSTEESAGDIKVTVEGNGDGVADATVTLYSSSGTAKGSTTTSSSGVAFFDDVKAGQYYVRVTQAAGFQDKQSSSFELLPDSTKEITVTLDPSSGQQKKLFLKFVDNQTDDPIEGVSVLLVAGNLVEPTARTSDEDGLVAIFNLNSQSTYGYIASHPDYVTRVGNNVPVVNENSETSTTVRLTRSTSSTAATVIVSVTNGGTPVNNALIGLFNADFNFPIGFGQTVSDGKKQFDDMPSGTYYAKVEVNNLRGESTRQAVLAGNTITLAVNLSRVNGGIQYRVKNASGSAIQGATVLVKSSPNNTLLDTLDTNSLGLTPVRLFSSGTGIFADVSAQGYVSHRTETRPIIVDVNQVVDVNLQTTSSVNQGYPLIEFIRLELLSGEPPNGILYDNRDYFLKFKVFVQPNISQGVAVIKLGHDLNFVSAEPAQGFTFNFYECDNGQNYYQNPSCATVNPSSADANLLLASFSNMQSMFYTLRAKIHVPDFSDAQTTRAVSFGVRTYDAFGETPTDPASGLKQAQFTFNSPVVCTGSNCPNFDFGLSIAETGTRAVVPFTNNRFTLQMGKTYDLNATVFNLDDQGYSNMVLKIKDPSAPYPSLTPQTILSFGNPFAQTFTSSTFSLSAASSASPQSMVFTNIPMRPDNPSTGVNVQTFLDTLTDPSATKTFAFAVNAQNQGQIRVEVNPNTIPANTQAQITVKVTDAAGTALNNAQVVLVPLAPNAQLPAPPFSCTPPNCYTTSSTGEVSVTLPVTPFGSSFVFIATHSSLPGVIGSAEVIVSDVLSFSGPGSGLDCVRVTPENVIFTTQLTRTFTVSTNNCPQGVAVEVTTLSADPQFRVTGLDSDNRVTLGANESKTLTIDISGANCNEGETGTGDGELCPGEYRVYVGAMFASEAQSGAVPARIHTRQSSSSAPNPVRDHLKVFKFPGPQDSCFDLCRGNECLLDDDSTDVTSFDVSLIGTGSGQADFTIKNHCVPNPPRQSIAYPQITLSSCANNGVCTQSELDKQTGTVSFKYKLRFRVGDQSPIESQQEWPAQAISLSGDFQDGPIDVVRENDEAFLALAEFENAAEQLEAEAPVYFECVVVPGSIQSTSSLQITEDMVECQDPPHEGRGTIYARVKGSNTPTQSQYDDRAVNNGLLSTIGAFLSVTDHVRPTEATQDPLPLGFRLEMRADNGCAKTFVGLTIPADGEEHLVARLSDENDLSCEGAVNYSVSVVSESITAPEGYTGEMPSAIDVYFKQGNQIVRTTTNPLLPVYGKIAQSVTYGGQNIQLVFLAQASGSMNDEWKNICEITASEGENSLAQRLSAQGKNIVDKKVFGMGDTLRDDAECVDAWIPWSDGLVGADYQKIGETMIQKDTTRNVCDGFRQFFNNLFMAIFHSPDTCTQVIRNRYVVRCEPGSQCLDAESEAWAPILQSIVRIYSGQDIGDNCPEGMEEICASARFQPAHTAKVIVVFADSDPTGVVRTPSDQYWRRSDNTYATGLGMDPVHSEKYVVEKLAEQINALSEETGNLNIHFIHGNFVYKPRPWWEGEGACADASDDCIDSKEAMQFLLEQERVDGGFVENAMDIPAPELVERIEDFIENEVETVPRQTEKFHVILDAGDSAVCYGHNDLQGTTGQYAFDFTRRSFNWTWNAGFSDGKSFCNPKLVSGQPNPNYVYCDSAQFMQLLMNRIVSIPSSTNYEADWVVPQSHFSSYLVKDGYGPDFLKDFSSWAKNNSGAIGQGVPTGLISSDFNLLAYVEQNRLDFNVSCATGSGGECVRAGEKILPATGYYEVEIIPRFDDALIRRLMYNGSPSARITVKLKLLDAVESNNLFYELPFDGQIGLETIGTTSQYNRTNYGVGYTGSSIQLFGAENSAVTSFASSASGMPLFTINVDSPDSQNALDRLNSEPATDTRGVVLKIVKQNPANPAGNIYDLTFIPSKATPVFARMDKPQDDSRVEGFFSLREGQTRYVNLGPNLSVWRGIASNIAGCSDFSGNLLERSKSDAPYSASADCSLRSQDTASAAYGFSYSSVENSLVPQANSIVFGTVLYTPLTSGVQYYLDDVCDDETQIGTSGSLTSGSVDLGAIPAAPTITVSDLLQKVRGENNGQGEFCIYNAPNALEIWFNENNILKQAVQREHTSGSIFSDGTQALPLCYSST